MRGSQKACPLVRVAPSILSARELHKRLRFPWLHLLSTIPFHLCVEPLPNIRDGVLVERLVKTKRSSSDHYAASDMSARAARAQSTSFCTVGAPLNPIAPTTSPFTLMGNPPPHAATRGSVGMPAKSDGSPWIKSKNSCVETPNRAV